METNESVVIKIMAKRTILRHKMVDQIKREISIMKIVKHPCIVRLHEVLASPTIIYIVLELVSGGELFDRFVHQRRLSESESRRYFQQLIDAVSHCHRKGVYRRDLKPENLLLDPGANLKVLDFGLGALPKQDYVKRHTRFISRHPAKVIISATEAAAVSLGLKVHTRNYKTRLEGLSANMVSQFAVVLEVCFDFKEFFVSCPVKENIHHIIKVAGDTLEYHKLYKHLCEKIDHIIWRPKVSMPRSTLFQTMTC